MWYLWRPRPLFEHLPPSLRGGKCLVQYTFWRPTANRYSAGFKHPNLSYSTTNVLNPQHQQTPYQHPPPYKQYAQPAQPSLRSEVDELKNLLRIHIQNSVSHMKFLETQITQVAQQINTRAPNQFPSQSEPKGKEPNQFVNAVTTRSGKQLADPPRGGFFWKAST